MPTIYHDVRINTTKEKLINAVVDPEQLNSWWTKKCTGNPNIGSEYNLYFAPEYNWRAKVSRYEAGEIFELRMLKAMPDWEPTSFCFEVEESTNGCILHFSHTNWLSVSNEFKTASFCWAMLLNGLKNYLEKGIIVPFEDRN